MITESDIVFEVGPGKAWVIKRRSTAAERKLGEDVGAHVWEVHRAFQTTCAISDSTYATEALAIARAEYIGRSK